MMTPTAEALSTFTILTTEADPFMARLHNRMPVILAQELEAAWLDPALRQAQAVLDVLARSTGLTRDAYPVSRMVNKPSYDSPTLMRRASSRRGTRLPLGDLAAFTLGGSYWLVRLRPEGRQAHLHLLKQLCMCRSHRHHRDCQPPRPAERYLYMERLRRTCTRPITCFLILP